MKCEWCDKQATHYCPCGEALCWSTDCINAHNKDERDNPWT
jgi:hypothetical protein